MSNSVSASLAAAGRAAAARLRIRPRQPGSTPGAAPWRDRRGQAAVEFAVVAGLFFVCLLVAIDVGRYYMTVQGLRTFIADSARYGVVNLTDGQCREGAALVTALGRGGVVGGLVASTTGACSGTPAACNPDVTALGPGICVSRRDVVQNGGYTTVTVIVTANVTFRFLVNVFWFTTQDFKDTTTLTFQM